MSFSLFADEFVVKSFTELTTDLSARKNPRVDVNDENCAIIKIRTDLKGLIFDTNLGVEGDIEKKTGEFWVYVSPGEKQIRIAKEDFILLPYNIPLTIKENTVYQMILTRRGIDENENTTGYILLTTEPEKSDVWIDGQSKGQSIIQAELQEGDYSYEIKKEMYHSKKGDFEIIRNETTELNEILQPNFGSLSISSTPEQDVDIVLDGIRLQHKTPFTRQKIISGYHTVTLSKDMFESVTKQFQISDSEQTKLNIDLNPKFAIITIQTDPQADIYLDNKNVGVEKYSGRLLKGDHRITIKKEMYEPINKEIEVIAGQDEKINLPLSPIFGEISITTSPDADIYLDGKLVGSETFNDIVISGIHTIEVKKEKYYTTTRKIDLQVGKKEQIDIELKPITGTLSIMTTPPKAEIYINGKRKGISPKIISDLQIGDYELKLSKEEYADYKETVLIKENKKTTVNKELNNAIEVRITSDPSDAEIIINGENKGKTPKNLSLPIGGNSIKLIKKEYVDLQEKFRVSKDKLEYNFTMEPEKLSIQINSIPRGAKIYIDGEYKGKTNKVISILDGDYSLELKKRNYQIVEDKLSVYGNIKQQYILKQSQNFINDLYIGFDFSAGFNYGNIGQMQSYSLGEMPVLGFNKRNSTRKDSFYLGFSIGKFLLSSKGVSNSDLFPCSIGYFIRSKNHMNRLMFNFQLSFGSYDLSPYINNNNEKIIPVNIKWDNTYETYWWTGSMKISLEYTKFFFKFLAINFSVNFKAILPNNEIIWYRENDLQIDDTNVISYLGESYSSINSSLFYMGINLILRPYSILNNE